MAKLTRVLQNIFGIDGATAEFGEIGSEQAGTPVTSKDLAVIQDLSQFAGGLYDLTNGGNETPAIQDINSLYYLITAQLKYLFQNGIPEWIATENYYANISLCQVAGVLYRSKTGTDGTPNINHNPATDTTHTYWNFGSESIKQLEFNATALGLPFDATDQYADMKQKIALGHKVGEIVESALDEAAVAYSAAQSTAHPAYPEYNPVVKLWDADHVLAQANYPLLFAKLFAVKNAAWSGSAYVTDHSVTVATSTITGSGTAWDTLLAAIVEDEIVHGSYTDYRTVNIAGTDYAITNVSTAAHTLTVTGTPASGAQTAILYANRIAGSTTTVRTYKDSGRATMSPDGTLRINGMRRRFHMQGHYHNPLTDPSIITRGTGSTELQTVAGSSTFYAKATTGAATTDGTNNTPITGPETEPNSTTVFRALWAAVLL
jgi:hypothetical protein